MGANVFANGLEVSCEKADNQVLAAMPDVCLSPPSPPAGPLPIPYPNFSSASDTTDGTKTVQIAGGQVGMKDKSCYKQSKGDEAATRSLGMGVTTACIEGKAYFEAWSSDVKFEGENAVRFSDLTTSNHASPAAANTECTGPDIGGAAAGGAPVNCAELQNDYENATNNAPPPRKSLLPENPPGTPTSNRTTMATGQYQPQDGPAESVKGFSRQLKNANGWSKGVGKDGTSNVGKKCPGATFDYTQKSVRPHSSHAEARIIEDIIGSGNYSGGGTLTLRIRWNSKDGMDSEPCEHCHRLICQAQEFCKLNIKICSDDDVEKKSQGQPADCSEP